MTHKQGVVGWSLQNIVVVIIVVIVLTALLFMIQHNAQTATQAGTGIIDKLFGAFS